MRSWAAVDAWPCASVVGRRPGRPLCTARLRIMIRNPLPIQYPIPWDVYRATLLARARARSPNDSTPPPSMPSSGEGVFIGGVGMRRCHPYVVAPPHSPAEGPAARNHPHRLVLGHKVGGRGRTVWGRMLLRGVATSARRWRTCRLSAQPSPSAAQPPPPRGRGAACGGGWTAGRLSGSGSCGHSHSPSWQRGPRKLPPPPLPAPHPNVSPRYLHKGR